jgi:DNA-binding CsgD family transcriptional regulator
LANTPTAPSIAIVRNGHSNTSVAAEGLERLSARETQVLEETALGLTNEQVAARLDVTVHAVKFHLGGIYRKLGVANRTEAAAFYLRSVATRSGGEIG